MHICAGGVNIKLFVSICPKIFLTGYLEDATYKTFLSGISEKEKQKKLSVYLIEAKAVLSNGKFRKPMIGDERWKIVLSLHLYS